MEKTGYYIYPTVPGSMDAFRWGSKGRVIKDVVLSNEEAHTFGMTEMTMFASHITAIAEDSSERTILMFQEKRQLRLQGLRTGRSLSTGTIMKMAPGRYTKLRFYISGKVAYLNKAKEEQGIEDLDYLDFTFKTPLEVSGDESLELILRFNFETLVSKSPLKKVRELKPVQWPSAKWA